MLLSDDLQSDITSINIVNEDMVVSGRTVNVCLSESVLQFIKDYQMLEQYEKQEECFHPVRNSSFEQRGLYIKLLILFCMMNNGMSARQIFHIADIAQQFEIKSSELLNVYKLMEELPIKQMEQIIKELVTRIETEERNMLIIDLLYLVCVGEYNENQKYDISVKLSNLLIDAKDYNILMYHIEKELLL